MHILFMVSAAPLPSFMRFGLLLFSFLVFGTNDTMAFRLPNSFTTFARFATKKTKYLATRTPRIAGTGMYSEFPPRDTRNTNLLTRHASGDKHNEVHGVQRNEETSDALEAPVSRAGFFGNLIPVAMAPLGVVFGVVALGLGLLYAKQDNLLYIPEIGGLTRDNNNNPPGYRSPAEYKSLRFETHYIESKDGVSIHSWLLLQPRKAPTIIFFHGNAGNIGIRIPNAIEMYENLGANVCLVEYRGYGESKPPWIKPSEAGIKEDSKVVLRFIMDHPHIDPEQIFIFGQSLGGAVGFQLAKFAQDQKIHIAGLIVENTFVSIRRMVDILLPLISPLCGLLLKMDWDSGKIAAALKVPILYLAAEADEIVPHSQMLELYARSQTCSVCARMHVVKGGTHNESWMQGGALYWASIRSFLKEAVVENSRT